MMKEFSEAVRYEYALTPSSLVIDAGAYLGKFANEIARRYDCRVEAYEPVFYRDWPIHHPYVNLHRTGLAGSTRMETFKIKGDMTGRFAEGDEIQVPLLDIVSILHAPVDLLKLNVEGMEFEILERLLDEPDHLKRIRNIQVQFHPVVEEAARRYDTIRSRLLQTHHLTYDLDWVWSNYERNECNE